MSSEVAVPSSLAELSRTSKKTRQFSLTPRMLEGNDYSISYLAKICLATSWNARL